MPPLTAIPGVVDVLLLHGGNAKPEAPPDLVIEIPHGATRTEDFRSLERQLTSPLPENLVDFFHVNTDAGAPELGEAVARRFVAEEPKRSVAILRCRIPRTFIDCNRVIDSSAADFKEGKVTPGLMPWITTPADIARLRSLHTQYVGAVRNAAEAAGTNGAILLLHTYAPRTVDVEVDGKIVENLRRAYRPEVEPTWPLRPEIDVIGKSIDGASLAPAAVVESLVQSLQKIGLTVADGATYPLHPSTMAWEHVTRFPGRALCLEVRRDLVADPWEPFAEMKIGALNVDRIARPLASALRRWW